MCTPQRKGLQNYCVSPPFLGKGPPPTREEVNTEGSLLFGNKQCGGACNEGAKTGNEYISHTGVWSQQLRGSGGTQKREQERGGDN